MTSQQQLLEQQQRRTIAQWSIVAICALLSIAFFLAAFQRNQNRQTIEDSDWGRRWQRQLGTQNNSTIVRVLPNNNGTKNATNNGTSILLCNGLANLCDVPANQIVYATVHNANSALVSGSVVVKNHVRSMRQALEAGYRGLNLDIGKCFGRVRLVHGTCLIASTDLIKMLTKVVEFLTDNPHEVIVIPAELANPLLGIADRVSLAEIQAAFAAVPGWTEQLYNHPGPGAPWPTLRELIAADTRILFFHYNALVSCVKGVDCPDGFHPWFAYAVETQYSFQTVNQLRDAEYACEITRGLSGSRDFFGVNVFVTPSRKTAALRVTNRASFLREHVAKCAEINGNQRVNLILVNFWGIGDVLEVVLEMNRAL